MIGMYLPVDGVGVDMVGEEFERVCMHIEGVFLGIVDADSTVGGHGITGILVVETIVAGQFVPVDTIYINNVAKSLARAVFAVMIDTVTRHETTAIPNDGTTKEP